MTHRGPFQPRPFCDSVILCHASPGRKAQPLLTNCAPAPPAAKACRLNVRFLMTVTSAMDRSVWAEQNHHHLGFFSPSPYSVIAARSPAPESVPSSQLWMHLFLSYPPGALQESSKHRLGFTQRFTFPSCVWEAQGEQMIKSALSRMTSRRRRQRGRRSAGLCRVLQSLGSSRAVFTLLFLLLSQPEKGVHSTQVWGPAASPCP